MKVHTTNNLDTFIEVAGDTKADCGKIPPEKNKKNCCRNTIRSYTINPYKYTSDDIFFHVFVNRKDLITAAQHINR